MIAQKTFVVGSDHRASNWIDGHNVHRLEHATLVLFTGGTDICPSIYKKNRNPMTDLPDSPRDTYEKMIFNEALELDIPMLGICRGSQLLCALSGGILVQHQEHPPSHDIITSTGQTITTNSSHHQRAYPFIEGCEHKLLAWAPNISPVNAGETMQDDMTGQPEAEVIFYPKTKALGIQGHPEWMWPLGDNVKKQKVMEYYRNLVSSLCEETL